MINNSVITTSNVNVEMSKTSTTQINLGNTDVRAILSGFAGSISMGTLRGKTVNQMPPTMSATKFASDPTVPVAGFYFYPNGHLLANGTGSTTASWHVLNPLGTQDDNFEVYVANTTGLTSSGSAVNQWLAANAAAGHSWIRNATTPSTNAVTLSVTVRRKADTGNDAGANQDTMTVTLTATMDEGE